MANILFVHQNFPGQFPHIVTALLARGDKVAAIGGKTAQARPGVDLRRWDNARGSTPGIFDIATRAEADMIRGSAAAAAALKLKADGFHPYVIIAHPGWGESLFLKEIWPAARLIVFGELLYRSHGGDVNFDPEFGQESLAGNVRAHAKNATQVLAAAYADRIICPTRFQADSYPPALQGAIRIVHEGVDMERAQRRAGASIALPDGRTLDGSKPVITFVSRTLEPLRGFHIFVRALPAFLAACLTAEVVVIGTPAVRGYGAASPNGRDWKSWLLEELGDRLDLGRVHFLGKVPHQTLVDTFSISWAHIYYTYPFVLSWSLVEAMAAECLIIGSDTAPVREAITDGVEGLLLPFFDVEALTHNMVRAVQQPDSLNRMRAAARSRALTDYDRAQGTALWLREIDALRAG
ncbi:glycosyltransferase [Sphingomonas sp. ASY06-1R]|uniref:glycosyltransferase n=1 Tax=Sphingomonas sp. ASY06-1R TaxID=3445771 RepID=UPI003FA22D54